MSGLTSTWLAARRGVQPTQIGGLRRAGELYAVRSPAGEWTYPSWQFDEGGDVKPAVRRFLALAADARLDADAVNRLLERRGGLVAGSTVRELLLNRSDERALPPHDGRDERRGGRDRGVRSPRRGRCPTAHVHPGQEERFEILRGTVGLKVGRERIVAGPGRRITVPPGTPHKFWNAGDEEAHFVCEIRPALQFEQLLETMFALAVAARRTAAACRTRYGSRSSRRRTSTRCGCRSRPRSCSGSAARPLAEGRDRGVAP